MVALQRSHQSSVNKHRRLRLFKRSRQRDADIGMLGFTKRIDHTTHYSELQLFDPRIPALPDRHAGAEISLDLFRHFLKERAGGPSASGTGRDLRGKTADSQGLQNLLSDKNFFRAVAVG